MPCDTRLYRRVARTVHRTVRRGIGVVEGIAFWSAVVLPILSVPAPILFAFEVIPAWLLASLIGLHVVTLVIGHRHNRPADSAGSLPGHSAETAEEYSLR